MNRKAPQPVSASTAVTVAPANGMLRKKRRSMNGSWRRDSKARNPVKASAATVRTARVPGSVQPFDGASMRTYTSANNVVMPSNWPMGSMSRSRDDLLSGTNTAVRTMASAQMGRLIQNTERQLTYSMSAPPTIGPSAIEMPTTAPQIPMARARSTLPVNTCVMIDIATGLSIDPPTAWTNRAAISNSMLGARLHNSEPAAKISRPAWNTRLRPQRSPAAPESSSSDASTRV